MWAAWEEQSTGRPFEIRERREDKVACEDKAFGVMWALVRLKQEEELGLVDGVRDIKCCENSQDSEHVMLQNVRSRDLHREVSMWLAGPLLVCQTSCASGAPLQRTAHSQKWNTHYLHCILRRKHCSRDRHNDIRNTLIWLLTTNCMQIECI